MSCSSVAGYPRRLDGLGAISGLEQLHRWQSVANPWASQCRNIRKMNLKDTFQNIDVSISAAQASQ